MCSIRSARIYSHDLPDYRARWRASGKNRWNGAFYYSKEIVANIIPKVETDRPWVTINQEGACEDGAIVFVHNNLRPDKYDWLKAYSDLILICGIPETCNNVAHLGRAEYLPLSVDVGYVQQFRRPKDMGAAFVGRASKKQYADGVLPHGTRSLSGMPRKELLSNMARYRSVYAVGRCAIEAKILLCDVLPYDSRFPDPSIWQIVDNSEAAQMLQDILDRIDG